MKTKWQPKIARLIFAVGLIIFAHGLIDDLPIGPIGTFLMGVSAMLNWGED